MRKIKIKFKVGSKLMFDEKHCEVIAVSEDGKELLLDNGKFMFRVNKTGTKRTDNIRIYKHRIIKEKIEPKYLNCIWCGKDLPKDKVYAMYCSKKCKKEAVNK